MEKRYDVFISYSAQDQKVVEGVCGFLEREGYRCFVAYRDIPRGVVWASAITDALDASKMMVVVFSNAFNMSKQTDREIEIASENDMPILTYRVAKAEMTGAKKYYLKNLNWIDAFPNPENYFGRLLDSVVKLIGPSKIVADKVTQEVAERLAKEETERKAREAIERERLERERTAEDAKRKAEQEHRERERAEAQCRAKKERSILNENDVKLKPKKGLWIALGVIGVVALLLFLVWPERRSLGVSGNYNGHDYVDLCLPSGTMWATCNVGANKSEEYGNYYAWGEIQTKSTYTVENYKYYANGEYGKLTKYCNKSDYGNDGFIDNLTILEGSDDPATAWGSGWHMPSKEQWHELLGNTTSKWTKYNGVKGVLFTAKNGEMLFLPAAGPCSSEFLRADSEGHYWSRSLRTNDDNPNFAHCLSFKPKRCYVIDFLRIEGYSVRPVFEN